MRNLLKTFVMAMAICMIPVGTANAAKVPKISRKSVNICIGDSAKLKIKNTKKSAKWKSGNKKVVSVSKKGKVTAKKSGSTKVIARIGKKKYKCKVTVKKQKLNEKSIELFVGENKKLKASGISKRADINWVSTNNDVATVYDGEVVAEGEGTTTVKAVIPDVFGKTLKCKVTIKRNGTTESNNDNTAADSTPNNNTQTPIEDTNTGKEQGENEEKPNNSPIKIFPQISSSGTDSSSSSNGSSATVITNTNAISIVEKEIIYYSETKSYDISMSGTTDIGTITWSSSNKKVLKVDKNGKAYGLCPGTATLKATTSKGLSDSINRNNI